MNVDTKNHPGFKQTTVGNWLEADPLMEGIVRRDRRDGAIYPVTGEDWINFTNGLSLSDSVPREVREAFQFVTGAIGYSYFYYPIFTIVSQQVLRVADFAVAKLFEAREMKNVRSFARRLALLREQGLLSEAEATRWDGIRRLRNLATHPSWQQNWGFTMSLDMIRIVANAVSNLPWPAPD